MSVNLTVTKWPALHFDFGGMLIMYPPEAVSLWALNTAALPPLCCSWPRQASYRQPLLLRKENRLWLCDCVSFSLNTFKTSDSDLTQTQTLIFCGWGHWDLESWNLGLDAHSTHSRRSSISGGWQMHQLLGGYHLDRFAKLTLLETWQIFVQNG